MGSAYQIHDQYEIYYAIFQVAGGGYTQTLEDVNPDWKNWQTCSLKRRMEGNQLLGEVWNLYSAHIGIDPTVIIDYESGTAKVNLIGYLGLGIGGRFGFDLDFNYRPIFDMLEELGFDFDD